MHRNTFLNSTKLLEVRSSFEISGKSGLQGRLQEERGYVAAISTGCIAAINIANKLQGKEAFILEDNSYRSFDTIYHGRKKKFQPMGPNFES